ncbi:MAG: hypothetical protein Q7Q71_12180 [Verrucomicrobiota bacterium JB023]|nr:hypothetical protein [Verrucomicrobiota bacterium JB023]
MKREFRSASTQQKIGRAVRWSLLLASWLPALGKEVTLKPNWTLYDPEGNSSLTEQSSSGFQATISGVSDALAQPAVVQEFEPVDMTQVGASLRARFEIDLLEDQLKQLDSGFRIIFYDTDSNYEFFLGIDMGAPNGTAMRMRIDNRISTEDEESPPGSFITGDYAHLGNGGGTLNPSGGNPNNFGLQYPEDFNTMELTLTRVSSTVLEFKATWISHTVEISSTRTITDAIIDESSAATIEANDVPPGGSFTQMNGIGFRIFNNDPFDADDDPTTLDSGSYRIANLSIDHSMIQSFSEDWFLYDPSGKSSLAELSDTGFTATITDITEEESRPAVLREFPPLALSRVGQSVEVNFDVQLLDIVNAANDTDFRFSFYDTSSNYEFVVGMIDLGPPGGTGMRMRIDNRISTEDELDPPGPFIPGDYSFLTNASGTLANAGSPAGDGLQYDTDLSHFSAKITRISETELQLETAWTYLGAISSETSSLSTIVDESDPTLIANNDVPPSGSFTEINGFGFVLFDNDPFDTDGNPLTEDAGSYTISNFQFRYCEGEVTPETIKVLSIVRDPESGDLTITWSSEPGKTYHLVESANLDSFSSAPVMTVTASGTTASHTLPAANLPAEGKGFYRLTAD